jgi:hypothetical protein
LLAIAAACYLRSQKKPSDNEGATTMKTLILFLVLCCMLTGAGCSGIAVSYDYDPQVDFTRLKTFDWHTFPSAAPAGELVAKHITNAIDSQLATKGFTRVSSNPDFLIAPHLGKQTKREVVDWGYSRQGNWGYGGRQHDVYEYQEGTLILDFIDPKAKELIWRGTAIGVVEPSLSPQERHKRLNTAVADILANFPPPKAQ